MISRRCWGRDVYFFGVVVQPACFSKRHVPFRVRSSTSDYFEANHEERFPTLVVVGGGAAGVYGAVRAKELCPNLQVLVLEKGIRLLSKVRISGGGRCNVTTGLFTDPLLLAEQYPRGHKELRGSFFRIHGPADTAAWFNKHGVMLKTEEDGRMFPVTDDSSTIINCLVQQARSLGVSMRTKMLVEKILYNDGKFTVTTKNNAEGKLIEIVADFLLLATGSAHQGYAFAIKLGHTIIEPRPSLFTFTVEDTSMNQLAGVSFPRVRAELICGSHNSHFIQHGPLLVTHWGLSGPVVLRLSAWAARDLFESNYQGTLLVDFLPELKNEDAGAILVKHKTSFALQKLSHGGPSTFNVVRRFWQYLLEREHLDGDMIWGCITNKALQQLVALLKRCTFNVSSKGKFKDEFVTAGGIPLKEVNLKTMESRICKNLYLAGEILNVDGVTGGFNFQNAWSGGYIAGSSVGSLSSVMSSRLLKSEE